MTTSADEPLFAPPPGPDDPFGMLRACHRKLEARLDGLLAAAEALVEGLPPDRRPAAAEALGAAIAQFDGPGRWHLADEEESVLPRLVAVDREAEALVATLAPQHAAIEAGWRALRPVLAGLCDALALGQEPDGELVERLAALVPPFRELHLEHHQIEETQVMPRARAALGGDDLAAIAAEMRARRAGGG